MFEPAGDKCFQFLFAQEDHYYLEGLVRFDFERYLYYCLKKAGYEGIFFLQDMRGSYSVRMEDQKSLDIYTDYIKRVNKTLMGKVFKSDPHSENPLLYYTQENGKQFSTTTYKNKDKNKLQNFIVDLIRQENDRYAFVLSAQTFNTLYGEFYAAEELEKVLKERRSKSTFFIVEPKKANESIPHLLKNREGEQSVLAERFCKKELENIIQQERRVQVFEELYNKMGNQYQVWNQLREKDIRRMLEYGMLFEAWDITPDEIDDVTAFIYAWYHSLTFAEQYRDVLPQNRWGSNSEVERFLVIPEKMNRVKQNVYELKQEDYSLKDIIARNYYLDNVQIAPVLEETAAYRCLNGIHFELVISDEESEQSEKLAEDFYTLKSELLVPYNFSLNFEKTIEWCADRLREIERKAYIDEDSVEWILNMINFTIHSELTDQEAFRKILDLYEQAIQASMMVSRLANEAETEEQKLQQQEKELKEQIQAAKKRRWLKAEGTTISAEVLSEDLEKEQLVNLYNNFNHRQEFLRMKKAKKIKVENAIQKLKLAIDSCHTDDEALLAAIAETLHEASAFLVESGVAETKAMENLSNRMREHKITEEEMANYRQEHLSEPQNDNIFDKLTTDNIDNTKNTENTKNTADEADWDALLNALDDIMPTGECMN